jgi:ATP-binding cassette subfamily B protein
MRTVWRSIRDATSGARRGVSTFAETTRPILRPFFPAFRVVIALLVLQIIVQSVYPLIYGSLTDALVDRDSYLAILLFGVLVAQGLLHLSIAYKRDLYEVDHIDWVMNLRIMTESLERISGFSLAQSSKIHSGKTRDIVRKGRLAIRHLVYLSLYMLGPTLLRLILALTYLVWVNLLIGSAAVIGTAIYLGYRISLFMRHRKPLKKLDDHDNEHGKLFADTLANMEVVMAYARQKRTVVDFDVDGKALVNHAQGFWRQAAGLYFFGFGIAMVTKYVIMGLTAWLLFGGQFSFGTYVALTQWAMMAMNATEELGRMQREISTQWSYAEHYLELLNKKSEITTKINALQPQHLSGHIEFDNVTFSYDPRASDDPLRIGESVVALNEVTFVIPSGQKVALIGESGAGKSTIAYALMRARDPQFGSIRIDGTDLRDFDQDAVRRRIGYVAQHPRLFDRTLRYNLVFGLEDSSPDPSDEELRELLEVVKLSHLADDGGLDRRLGESGHTLSGGERQRLCIARALIKDPDVLIFDEATSSLDPVNEKKVQDAIDAAGGRTKLIIAHRYSTIRDVDRILVFDAGRLVDDGTHEELLAGSLYYRKLLEQQGLL